MNDAFGSLIYADFSSLDDSFSFNISMAGNSLRIWFLAIPAVIRIFYDMNFFSAHEFCVRLHNI